MIGIMPAVATGSWRDGQPTIRTGVVEVTSHAGLAAPSSFGPLCGAIFLSVPIAGIDGNWRMSEPFATGPTVAVPPAPPKTAKTLRAKASRLLLY